MTIDQHDCLIIAIKNICSTPAFAARQHLQQCLHSFQNLDWFDCQETWTNATQTAEKEKAEQEDLCTSLNARLFASAITCGYFQILE